MILESFFSFERPSPRSVRAVFCLALLSFLFLLILSSRWSFLAGQKMYYCLKHPKTHTRNSLKRSKIHHGPPRGQGATVKSVRSFGTSAGGARGPGVLPRDRAPCGRRAGVGHAAPVRPLGLARPESSEGAHLPRRRFPTQSSTRFSCGSLRTI